MKIKFLLIILLLGGIGFVNAKEVPRKLAEKVAKNFFYQHVNQVKSMEYADINLSLVSVNNKEAHTTYYAFDINNKQGFILVSADDGAKPVLAYAFKGEFNAGNMHPGQAGMLDWYANQIAYIANNNIKADEKITEQWQSLIDYTPEKGIKTLRNVEPLLLSEWNQGYPYNQMCPEDADGIAGHVPVGCVATAMGQVMKYWDYPETGTGSKTHWSYNYGTFSVNFANQTYNWAGIPLSGNGLNDELAKINFHIGVAVEMGWGPEASGSYTWKVVDALKDYFQYDPSCQLKLKSEYATEAQYKEMLRSQLDNKYPMVYSGSSTESGHAWNCDGYLDDEFHMNWGWGGAGNGYYTLDDLTSTAMPGGDENNFNNDQKVVRNIFPEDNYPEYCSGTKNINYHQGAFGDGSADEDYQNNISCQYLISPDCGQIITLDFEQFDLADGDVIHIYDGETTGAPLLETFDMDNIPTSSVQTNYGNLLIEFLTDGSTTADGWYVSFNSDYCKTGLSYTSLTGTVSDGSGPCDYQGGSVTVCSWYIEPENAESIHLDFTEFDLGGSIDYLDVFRNNSSDLVEKFDATNTPTELIIDAPVVFLQFFTDANDDVGAGFTIDYSTTVGIENHEIINKASVFPNPSSGQINLTFSLVESSDVNIRVYNMLGKTIGKTSIQGNKGYQKIELDKLINIAESGIYLVDVSADNQTITKRISIIK